MNSFRLCISGANKWRFNNEQTDLFVIRNTVAHGQLKSTCFETRTNWTKLQKHKHFLFSQCKKACMFILAASKESAGKKNKFELSGDYYTHVNTFLGFADSDWTLGLSFCPGTPETMTTSSTPAPVGTGSSKVRKCVVLGLLGTVIPVLFFTSDLDAWLKKSRSEWFEIFCCNLKQM